jgi:TPR repeat protein
MYDAALAAHVKGSVLGTYLVMLCHEEGRAVRSDEPTYFKFNFALRATLVKKEKPTAIECYILSKTQLGNADGALDLTKVDNPNEFKKADEKKRQDWLQKAWDMGFVQAGFDLGMKHQKAKQDKEAYAWFDKAAQKGLAAALRSKGFYLIVGKGVEKNLEQGLAVTLAAANAGDVFAMTSMGYYYGAGLGVKEDPAQAKAWVEKAGQTGHWMGYLEMAQLQFRGKHGFALDKKEAEMNLQKALKTRNRDVLEILTMWYADGVAVEVDGKKAIKYGEAAFVQGSLKAPLYLHTIYKEGIGGVAKDEKLANFWGVQANPNFAFALGAGLEKQYPELTKHLKTLDPWSLD